MSNIIHLDRHKKHLKMSKNVEKLLKISEEIDAVIIKHLAAGDVDPKDLAGLLAHRLGNLMRNIEQKGKLWDVCEKVARKQAAIE